MCSPPAPDGARAPPTADTDAFGRAGAPPRQGRHHQWLLRVSPRFWRHQLLMINTASNLEPEFTSHTDVFPKLLHLPLLS